MGLTCFLGVSPMLKLTALYIIYIYRYFLPHMHRKIVSKGIECVRCLFSCARYLDCNDLIFVYPTFFFSSFACLVFCIWGVNVLAHCHWYFNHSLRHLSCKVSRVELCAELFYAIIPTLFLCFLLICYPYISLHF